MERGKLEDFYSKRFYWKEGEGGGRKIKEIRMTGKARKKEWNWILAWSVEIRGSSWIASDHRSQRSCSELSNPGFLTHTCNIHRDIFAFRHRRRDAIRCLPRYYVAGIARFLVHFFFSSFFFFILLEIDPAGSSFSGEIFLSPGVNRGILFWIENKRRERRRSVKYFKVSMWDFLNCSPSGIGMNTEVEEFWWILCAQCSMIWRYLKDVEMQDWKNDERYSFFIVLFYLSVGKNDDRCKFSIDYYMVNCDTYIKWSWFKLFSGLID